MPKATSAKAHGPKRGKPGRPSLIHDKERVARLLEAVRDGNWLTTAAALAGIGRNTVTDWLRRGREARAMADAGSDVADGEEVYRDFAEDFERADAEAEIRIVANVTFASSPTASLGFLKLRWPEHWREAPAQVEMSGPQGAPLPLSPVLAAMSDEELHARIRALEAEILAEGNGMA